MPIEGKCNNFFTYCDDFSQGGEYWLLKNAYML